MQVKQEAELLKWCTKALLADTSYLSLIQAKEVIDMILLSCETCQCDTEEDSSLLRAQAKAPLLYASSLYGLFWDTDFISNSIKILIELREYWAKNDFSVLKY